MSLTGHTHAQAKNKRMLSAETLLLLKSHMTAACTVSWLVHYFLVHIFTP